LDVVDCHRQWPELGERTQRGVERDGHGTVVGRRPVKVTKQKRDLERPALRSGQLGQQLVEHRGEQITDCDEREAGLLTCWSARQHAVSAIACQLEPSLPDRRLADSELALEQQGPGIIFEQASEEARDRGQLRVPTDDFGACFSHAGERGSSQLNGRSTTSSRRREE
jgi:hypothetical protein